MFKPTLAVNADLTKLTYPVYASPKLDGIRCSIVQGRALTRTLKAIPNKDIFAALSKHDLNGLDGELIVGDPTAKDVYTKTVSQIMSHGKGVANVTYYVFDVHDIPEATYRHRLDCLLEEFRHMQNNSTIKLEVLPQALIQCHDDLVDYEAETVAAGYAGVILRHPEAPYKFGRSTVKEGFLLKVKRFSDFECSVIGFEEEQHNGNCSEVNELGRTKRSSAKAGKSGKGTLGAFTVRDITTGVEFSIGTGLTAAQRQQYWDTRDSLVGAIIKYKCFEVGVKIAPRHPVFLGFRSPLDL